MTPTLSVVIPVLGEEDRLARCLRAVARATSGLPEGEAEVVVADDGTPGGLEALRGQNPGVRFLEPTRRLGFGANMNRAVEASRGRLVCLLNSDMYVDADFFRDYARPFDDDPALFAVCARIREPGGVNAGLKQLDLSPRRAGVHFARDDDPASEKPARVPYANGGGAVFRRDLFLALGGFDAVFHPYYWEDTDLGYRAWKRGFEIRYDPARALRHDHQATIGREGRRRVSRVKARNQRLFLWRNLTGPSLAGLVLRGWLPVLMADLLRLRLRRAGWALADLLWLGRVARHRAAERGALRRSDAEVSRLLGDALRLDQ